MRVSSKKKIHASSRQKLDWKSIDWKEVKKKVKELQMRIAKVVLCNRTSGSPQYREEIDIPTLIVWPPFLTLTCKGPGSTSV